MNTSSPLHSSIYAFITIISLCYTTAPFVSADQQESPYQPEVKYPPEAQDSPKPLYHQTIRHQSYPSYGQETPYQPYSPHPPQPEYPYRNSPPSEFPNSRPYPGYPHNNIHPGYMHNQSPAFSHNRPHPGFPQNHPHPGFPHQQPHPFYSHGPHSPQHPPPHYLQNQHYNPHAIQDPHEHHVSIDHLRNAKEQPHQRHLHRPMLFKYIQLLKNPENFTVLIRSIARMNHEQVQAELKRYTEMETKLEALPPHNPIRVFIVCMVNLLKNQPFFVNFKSTLPAMSQLLMQEYQSMYPEDFDTKPPPTTMEIKTEEARF